MTDNEQQQENSDGQGVPQQALEWVDKNFRGALSGVAKQIAGGLETHAGISADSTRKFLPAAAALAAGGVGALLLAPLTKIGQFALSLVKGVVTGGGYFEKIPLAGGLFTGAGRLVDYAGKAAGAALAGVGAFLAFKAFQVDPDPIPPGRNLDLDKEKKDNDGTSGMALPVAPKPPAPRNAPISPEEAARRARDAVKRLKTEWEKPTAGKKPASPKQIGELEKAAGGPDNFNRLHKEMFGDERPADGTVNNNLTEELARSLKEALDAQTDQARAEFDAKVGAKTGGAQAAKPGWGRWLMNKLSLGLVSDGRAAQAQAAAGEMTLDTVFRATHDPVKSLLEDLTKPATDSAPTEKAPGNAAKPNAALGSKIGPRTIRAGEGIIGAVLAFKSGEEAFETFFDDKYPVAKAGDTFGHDHLRKTHKVVTETRVDTNLAKLGIAQKLKYKEVDKDGNTLSEGECVKLDPKSWGHGVLQGGNVVAGTSIAGGRLFGSSGVTRFGGKLCVGVYIANEGAQVTELMLNGEHGKAVAKTGTATGKLMVMSTGLPGVAIVMIGDSIADIDDICAEVAANFPEAKRKYYLLDKDGKREPITLKNAYKLNPTLKAAIEQAASSGTGPVSVEERNERLEKMITDPLHAWKVIWKRKTKEDIDDQKAQDTLREYARKEYRDLKPNAFLKFLSVPIGPDFKPDNDKAELAAIARELVHYAGDVGATYDNLHRGTGTSGQAPIRGASGIPAAPAPVALPTHAVGYGVELQPGADALRDVLIKDGLVTGYRKKHADNLTLLMRYDSQRHENVLSLIREIRRAALGSKSDATAEAGRNRLIALLKDKGSLSDAEAKALAVSTPDLRVTVYPGLQGFDSDGVDIPRHLEAFAKKYQEFYGVDEITVQESDGRKVGKSFGDMSITQKNEFLYEALKRYNERMEFYQKRFSYPGYDYTVDNTGGMGQIDALKWFSRGFKQAPEGTIMTANGVKKFSTEHAFLMYDLSDAVSGTKVLVDLGYGLVEATYRKLDDTTRKEARDLLRSDLHSFTEKMEGHKAYLRDHEESDHGKIRQYIRHAQFMEASLRWADKGVMPLASDGINQGMDPSNGRYRPEGKPWILLKTLEAGGRSRYYYALGEWNKNGDAFTARRFVDHATGTEMAASDIGALPLAIDFAKGDASSGEGLAKALTNLRPMEPADYYREFAADFKACGMEACAFDAVKGDKRVQIGKDVEITFRTEDNKATEYTLKGTWAVGATGKILLRPKSVSFTLPKYLGGETTTLDVPPQADGAVDYAALRAFASERFEERFRVENDVLNAKERVYDKEARELLRDVLAGKGKSRMALRAPEQLAGLMAGRIQEFGGAKAYQDALKKENTMDPLLRRVIPRLEKPLPRIEEKEIIDGSDVFLTPSPEKETEVLEALRRLGITYERLAGGHEIKIAMKDISAQLDHKAYREFLAVADAELHTPPVELFPAQKPEKGPTVDPFGFERRRSGKATDGSVWWKTDGKKPEDIPPPPPPLLDLAQKRKQRGAALKKQLAEENDPLKMIERAVGGSKDKKPGLLHWLDQENKYFSPMKTEEPKGAPSPADGGDGDPQAPILLWPAKAPKSEAKSN